MKKSKHNQVAPSLNDVQGSDSGPAVCSIKILAAAMAPLLIKNYTPIGEQCNNFRICTADVPLAESSTPSESG